MVECLVHELYMYMYMCMCMYMYRCTSQCVRHECIVHVHENKVVRLLFVCAIHVCWLCVVITNMFVYFFLSLLSFLLFIVLI